MHAQDPVPVSVKGDIMLTASNLFISGFRTALRSRAGAPSGPWFWLLEGLTCFLWGRTVWTFFLSISCLCVFVDLVFLPRGSCWTFFPLPSIQDLAQPVTAGETIWSLHHFLWDLHSFMCFSGPERSKISIMMECPPCLMSVPDVRETQSTSLAGCWQFKLFCK